jgi:hypothetical protein
LEQLGGDVVCAIVVADDRDYRDPVERYHVTGRVRLVPPVMGRHEAFGALIVVDNGTCYMRLIRMYRLMSGNDATAKLAAAAPIPTRQTVANAPMTFIG